MSFIKKDDDNKSSLWDWVILVVLVVGGVSFWWYYSRQKTNTTSGFAKADSLFQSGNYGRSLKLYEELKFSDYLETAHDSLLTERLDTLYTIFEEKETLKKTLEDKHSYDDLSVRSSNEE